LKLSGSDRFTSGAWMKLRGRDGKEFKFQRSHWINKLQEPDFRQAVLDIMDEEIIKKFESEGKNVNIDPED
jgi:hypothetical protein